MFELLVSVLEASPDCYRIAGSYFHSARENYEYGTPLVPMCKTDLVRFRGLHPRNFLHRIVLSLSFFTLFCFKTTILFVLRVFVRTVRTNTICNLLLSLEIETVA